MWMVLPSLGMRSRLGRRVIREGLIFWEAVGDLLSFPICIPSSCLTSVPFVAFRSVVFSPGWFYLTVDVWTYQEFFWLFKIYVEKGMPMASSWLNLRFLLNIKQWKGQPRNNLAPNIMSTEAEKPCSMYVLSLLLYCGLAQSGPC